jgi:hypothetical protein
MQSWLHLQINLTLFDDPYLHLGMCYIIPLLENIDCLVQFAQQSDVFICVLMVLVKICQGQFYSLYNDVNFSFSNDALWAFEITLLNCSHEHIHMKWTTNLNDSN